MPPRRLAVVVLTWNGRDDTLACLDSLRGELGPGDAVVVVDNGSADGTEAAVRERHPWAELVQNGTNRGFAGGNDAGLRWALERGFPWVMLLNNDTVVPPGTLAALLAEGGRRPGAGALQPLLVRAADPDTIDSAGHLPSRTPGVSDRGMGTPAAAVPPRVVSVFGACAAAVLLRADALRGAGLLDEGFFVLFEDVDLMFRLRLAGWDVVLVPSARVLHRRGVSGGRSEPAAARRRRFWADRNLVALALRYWPAGALAAAAPSLALRALRAAVLGPRVGERCAPLWRASLAMRCEARRGMERLGLDAWLGGAPRDATPPRDAAPPGPATAAVVVHYRGEDDVRRCVESLAADAPGMPVVVVENGSGDGACARLAAAFAERPEVVVLDAEENRGFGAGCNRGIGHALAAWPSLRHVLLLNPDARAEPGCVAALTAEARSRPAAGIVGGRVLSGDGTRTLYENGRFRPWTLGASHCAAPPGRDAWDTEFVTGALMLLDADLLRAGLRFDERYFLYVEDLDLCREVAARGRTMRVTSRAAVRHAEGGSQRGEAADAAGMRPGQLRWITRNKVIFARRRLPWPQRLVFLAVALVAKPVAGVLRHRSAAFLPAYLAAFAEGLRAPAGDVSDSSAARPGRPA